MESNKVNTITRLIENSNGKFMTVTFVKKDGQERTLNGRIGVHYNGEAAPSRFDAHIKPYLLLWEVKTRGFRRINLDTIKAINTAGVRFTLEPQ